MKPLYFLFRVGVSLSLAFAASFSSAVIFFDYSGYKQWSDRAFLVAVPTLAIAFLIFESFPKIWSWLAQRQVDVLIGLAFLAVLVALVAILPFAISRVYYLGMFAFAAVVFSLMLPVTPVIERLRSIHHIGQYFLGFLLNLLFVYAAVGFFNSIFSSAFQIIVFTFVFSLLGSVIGYYCVRRMLHSFQDGFLNNLLNILLVITLPLFFIGILKIILQFPAMFNFGYIQLPKYWFGPFMTSSVISGVWSISLFEQFETRGFYTLFKQTRIFTFIKENLPGIYAAMMFSMINFVIARALNHPTFSLNSLFFRADSGLFE